MRDIYRQVIEALIKRKDSTTEDVIKEFRKKVSTDQWGLFQILFFGVLDWQSHLLAVLSSYSTMKVKKFKEEDLYLLLTAIYAILYLDKPQHATVNEAVESMKIQNPRLVAMTNAILRSILREEDLDGRVYGKMKLLPALEKKYGYPLETIKLFLKELGEEGTKTLLESSKEAPRLDFLVLGDQGEALALLDKEGHEYKALELDRAYSMIKNLKPLNKIQAYVEGRIYYQSENSQRIASFIPTGKNLLDLCGAPGGKSFSLLAREAEREVTICDISQVKLDLIRENANRLKLEVSLERWDALELNEKWKDAYSAVLVDAPCSGTGVLHRHRGESFSKDLSDIIELIRMQRTILDKAATYVENGGFLIYSTCSILRGENENQIEKFLSNHPEFTLVDLESNGSKYYKSFPGRGEDGFFACLMEKRIV